MSASKVYDVIISFIKDLHVLIYVFHFLKSNILWLVIQ
jgi:hypothetical protein